MSQQGPGMRPIGRGGSGMNLQGGTAVTLISVGIVILIAIVIVTNSMTIVDAGTRGVLKTFGKVTGILNEGLNFRTPFITTVTIIDVKTQRYASTASTASRDLQIVKTEIVINYHPNPEAVGRLVQEIGVEYEARVINPSVQEALKAATAMFTAEELITRRPDVSAAIQATLQQRLTEERGIIVETVSITDFNFSEEFARAIEAKQVAEQDALRAERELRRAQIESQQQVARAKAEAESKLQVARAEAESLRLQREVISPELLQLRFIERWNGILPQFLGGDTGMLPLINIPEAELRQEQSRPTVAPTTQAEPEPTPTTTP